MLCESPVIVLKAVDFKESSKIITVFSREHGKVAVLVRGVKRKKNRYAGLINYGSVLNLSYYYKEARSVQNFKDAERHISTVKTQADFVRLALVMAFLELITQLIQEGEPNDELFDFTSGVLSWVETTDSPVRNLFPYLQYRVAELMGVGLQHMPPDLLDNASSSQKIFINVIEGTLSSIPGDGRVLRLTSPQIIYLSLASRGKSAQIPSMDISSQELKQLINHFDVYLKYHIDGVRDRKSDAVFDQIL